MREPGGRRRRSRAGAAVSRGAVGEADGHPQQPSRAQARGVRQRAFERRPRAIGGRARQGASRCRGKAGWPNAEARWPRISARSSRQRAAAGGHLRRWSAAASFSSRSRAASAAGAVGAGASSARQQARAAWRREMTAPPELPRYPSRWPPQARRPAPGRATRYAEAMAAPGQSAAGSAPARRDFAQVEGGQLAPLARGALVQQDLAAFRWHLRRGRRQVGGWCSPSSRRSAAGAAPRRHLGRRKARRWPSAALRGFEIDLPGCWVASSISRGWTM